MADRKSERNAGFDPDHGRHFTELFNYARIATNVIGGLLGLTFTILQLRDIDFGSVVEYTSAQFYIRVRP